MTSRACYSGWNFNKSTRTLFLFFYIFILVTFSTHRHQTTSIKYIAFKRSLFIIRDIHINDSFKRFLNSSKIIRLPRSWKFFFSLCGYCCKIRKNKYYRSIYKYLSSTIFQWYILNIFLLKDLPLVIQYSYFNPEWFLPMFVFFVRCWCLVT